MALYSTSRFVRVTTPSCYKLVHLDAGDLTLLKSVYQLMYVNTDIVPSDLGESIHKYGSIKIWSTTFGSKLQPRGIRSGQILASWPANNGQVLKETFCVSAGTAQYYFRHSIKLGNDYLTHYFACMRWYIPDEDTDSYGNPCSFMPVQRIFSRFATAKFEQEGEKKIAVSPIIRNVHS